MEYFKNLPEEITLDILSRVPTETVLDCKLVCKTWNNVVRRHPSFSKMHLHHLNHPADSDSGKLGFIAVTNIANEKLQYFDLNQNHEPTASPIQRIRRVNIRQPFECFRFVGSSDGLICLTQYWWLAKQPVFICNPITRECVVLPEIEIKTDSKDDNDVYWTCGFGHVPSTDEYKVVGIHWLRTAFVQVHIYTLGSGNGWRDLGKFNQFTSTPFQQAIFANGALYWLDMEVKRIISFDLAEERFCEYLSPSPLPQNDIWNMNRIGVLDGFLFIATYLVGEGGQCYDVWLLRKKNGSHGMTEELEEHRSLGWTKKFRINVTDLFAVTKTGGVLTYERKYINICDTNASTSIRLADFKEFVSNVFHYKSTFISLKDLGEADTKIMESIEIEEMESHAKPSVIGG